MDLVGLQWGVRGLLLMVSLGTVAIAVLVFRVLVVPVITEARRARRAGDWWLPFLPDAEGDWGPLASNRHWSVMRAERRGSPVGLGSRWGSWVVLGTLLTFACGLMLVDIVRLVAPVW